MIWKNRGPSETKMVYRLAISPPCAGSGRAATMPVKGPQISVIEPLCRSLTGVFTRRSSDPPRRTVGAQRIDYSPRTTLIGRPPIWTTHTHISLPTKYVTKQQYRRRSARASRSHQRNLLWLIRPDPPRFRLRLPSPQILRRSGLVTRDGPLHALPIVKNSGTPAC